MKRSSYLIALVAAVFGLMIAAAGADVWPVRFETPDSVQSAALPPSLVLADGGLEFPDGSVQSTASGGGPPAPVPRTGQSVVVGTGDDGDLQLGVTWPNPRFTDNGDGTVTDNLTDLIWLGDASCFGAHPWPIALAKATALFDGCSDCGGTNSDCGLTDGSIAGQWRLANVRELHSLIHYGQINPAVPNTAGTGQWSEGDPFSAVEASYWSSTTDAGNTTEALVVNLDEGDIAFTGKVFGSYAWPVRGGY